MMQPKAKTQGMAERDALPSRRCKTLWRQSKLSKRRRQKGAEAGRAKAASAATATAELATQNHDESDQEPDAAANDVGLTDEEYMRLRMKHKVGTDLDTLNEESPSLLISSSLTTRITTTPSSRMAIRTMKRSTTRSSNAKQAESRRKAEIAAEKDQKIVDQIMESGRLFIRNLPFAASEDEIQSFFESFGTV